MRFPSFIARFAGRTVLPFFLTALVASPSAWARTELHPPEATNLSPSQVEALVVLFRDSYSVYAGEELELVEAEPKPEPDPALESEPVPESDPEPEKQPRPVADETIELSFVRLESRVQVQATRSGPSGETLHTVRATMESLDDAPEILDRVALALHRGVAFERTATYDPAQAKEAAPARKEPVRPPDPPPKAPKKEIRDSEFVSGFKLGFVFPYSPRQAFDGYVSAGYNGRIEVRSFFFELGAGLGLPLLTSDANRRPERWQMGGLYTEVSFNGYLTRTDVSPYLGVGISPRLWFTNRSAGTNLLPFVQGGAMFFRKSSMRFFTDVRAGYNLTPLREIIDSRELHPFEFGLNLGLGF